MGAQCVISCPPSTNFGGHGGQLGLTPASPGQRFGEHVRLGALTEEITPELVDEVVEHSGRTEVRRRLLPARTVVYFVLALCLFSSSDSTGPPGYLFGPAHPDGKAATPAKSGRAAAADEFGADPGETAAG
ncbi:transposase domain-containing protein [Streptomyces sp. NPDC002911]